MLAQRRRLQTASSAACLLRVAGRGQQLAPQFCPFLGLYSRYPAREGALLEAFLRWSGIGARGRGSQPRTRGSSGLRPRPLRAGARSSLTESLERLTKSTVPGSEIAELERRRAIRALSCGFAARRLARKGTPLRPKAVRPPSSHPSAAKNAARERPIMQGAKQLDRFSLRPSIPSPGDSDLPTRRHAEASRPMNRRTHHVVDQHDLH